MLNPENLTASSMNVSLSSQLVQARADLAKVSWVPLPLILGFTVAFNLGLGSLTWVVATEVLPVNSRGWTHTLANLTSNLCWFLVTKTFRDLQVVAVKNRKVLTMLTCRTPLAMLLPSISTAVSLWPEVSSSSSSCRRRGARLPRKPRQRFSNSENFRKDEERLLGGKRKRQKGCDLSPTINQKLNFKLKL